MDRQLNLTTDFYQLTMMYGYWVTSCSQLEQLGLPIDAAQAADLPALKINQPVVFQLFYRQHPNGYIIAAGLEQIVNYLHELSFSSDDIRYLRSLNAFHHANPTVVEGFYELLRTLRFTGTLDAVPEGTVLFPQEPAIRVKARLLEAQLIETTLLNLFNHQSLIATKASRLTRAAKGRPVMEFGARRAQGPDAAVYGSRAAYIGGVDSTATVEAGHLYGIPVSGTHAHSWIMSFPSEEEAFDAYTQSFPDQAILLVDTYDALRSGIPNAISSFQKLATRLGRKPVRYGIRIDSGDLAYLSVQARRMLNEAGFEDAWIVVSSDLNEDVITDLLNQGAQIDAFGVGTELITSKDYPALGGVYKIAAVFQDGAWQDTLKISENPAKITNPGSTDLVRFVDQRTGFAVVDLIIQEGESLPAQPFETFDPVHTYKKKWVDNCTAYPMLQRIFDSGRLVYPLPTLSSIRSFAALSLQQFSREYHRLNNPHLYHVNLSDRLWEKKRQVIERLRKQAGRTADNM